MRRYDAAVSGWGQLAPYEYDGGAGARARDHYDERSVHGTAMATKRCGVASADRGRERFRRSGRCVDRECDFARALRDGCKGALREPLRSEAYDRSVADLRMR